MLEESEMTTHRFSFRSLVLLCVLAVCLYSCAGKSASPKFYVLSALPQSKVSGAEGTAIGVFPAAMPEYLDRPQIVTRVSPNEIRIEEFNRWAEPLKTNFHSVLTENLSVLLGTARVIKMPQIEIIPDCQVLVEVVQFDGNLGGDVVLIAKWRLLDGAGKKVLVAKKSSFSEPTGAATYEALVAAQSRAAAALSREIAETIRTRK